jgi:P-type Cu+ transporter
MVVRDPVCGMQLMPEEAWAVRFYGGQTYYFCSARCAEEFEDDPEEFVAPKVVTTADDQESEMG